MSIKKFIKIYIDKILIVFALFLVRILVWFFIDSTSTITANFSKALSQPSVSGGSLRFNLDGAKNLNLRGLSE